MKIHIICRDAIMYDKGFDQLWRLADLRDIKKNITIAKRFDNDLT